ncbi:ABC transporter permease [Kibdelosporangium aridum]|uniref:Transport permease protein n=2 Tax=Kibdelosporangium aridum TaxID=2030 RepID=A0A428ZKZ4_KIBAR|nr:ABC transporter permease [Kibdelosporangium aridum]
MRDKTGPLWGVGFPLVLLIILGSVPALNEPQDVYGGRTTFDLYVPVLALFNLAMLALSAMPTMLAAYRENGVLRRMRTTPISPARVLGAQVAANSAMAIVAVVLFLVVANVAFGVRLPENLAGFAVGWLLAGAALISVGMLITAVAPGRGVATAIGTVLFFPMMFFAGLWIPLPQMPQLLQDISAYTPLGAGAIAMQAASAGDFPDLQPLLVLAGYAVVCAAAAVRWFRWQ